MKKKGPERYSGAAQGTRHVESPADFMGVGFAGTLLGEYEELVDWLRSEVKSSGEHTRRVAQVARGDYPLIIRFFLKVLRIAFNDEKVDEKIQINTSSSLIKLHI